MCHTSDLGWLHMYIVTAHIWKKQTELNVALLWVGRAHIPVCFNCLTKYFIDVHKCENNSKNIRGIIVRFWRIQK